MCYSESNWLKPIRNALDVVSGYKSIDAYNTVFKEISPTFYRENYHSDLLCYLLKNSEIRRCFLDWLSKEKSVIGTPISIESIQAYDEATVVREEGRIDIAVYSTDKTKVILIENKSNQAGDQHYQIPSYFSLMKRRSVVVECVVYLNRSELNEPRYAEWSKSDLAQIKPILLVTQLRGERSFSTNALSPFLSATNDLRMSGIGREVQLFFDSLVFGEMNMDKLQPFVAELAKDGNLKKFQDALRAYNDIPKFLQKNYQSYCETTHNKGSIKYRIYKDLCLVLEGVRPYLAIDIFFTHDDMDISLVPREHRTDKVEELRKQMGASFPFPEKGTGHFGGERYRRIVAHHLDDTIIRETIDDIISRFEEKQSSTPE